MKKVVSLLLVLVLAIGMSSVAFAAGPVNSGGSGLVSPSGIGGASGVGGGTWTAVFGSYLDANFGDTVYPGDTLEIFMPASYFTASVTASGASLGITKSQVRAGKVSPRIRIAKGSNIIDSYSIDYYGGTGANRGLAFLKVEFINPYVSVDDVDFEFKAYLVVDGDSYVDAGINFVGTFDNLQVEDIDKDTYYVDLIDGRKVECIEYNSKVEYDLGNGISLWGKAFKGKKYYGYSTTDLTDAQADIVDKYDIYQAYIIKQVNLQAVSSYVVLGDADKDMYVYDKDLKYLGRGNAQLPFSDTYYLASKQLDVDDDEEPDEEDDDDAPALPPGTGGDSEASLGVNDNPSTGA